MRIARITVMTLLLFVLLNLARAQTQPVTFTVAATAVCGSIRASNNSTVGIIVSGTWSGTLTPNVQISTAASAPTVAKKVVPVDSTTGQATITANGGYRADVSGFTQFNVCSTGTWTSGTATVTLYAVQPPAASTVAGSSGGAVTSVSGTAPVASSGGATPAISLQNSASANVTAALGTDTKYFTASGSAAVNGDVISGDAQGGIKDSGTLLSSLAPLASPALTGAPTAPTQTAGDSSTDIATDAFVAASFAPLASPALTGTPTAPTAANGTSTTQLATTAFVANTFTTQPGIASAWLTYPTLGSGTPTTGGTANRATLWGVVLQFPLTTTKVTYETITADTSGGTYDIGFYTSAGVLAAHIGNTAAASCCTGTNTIHTVNWTGTATLQPGKYYVAITCSATALCATFGGASSNGVTFVSNTAVVVTSGGTLSTPITPPADSMSYGSAIPVMVVQ